ncbi:MAG: ABC transporter ATP-binding protein [Desulfobaccales bacterium]
MTTPKSKKIDCGQPRPPRPDRLPLLQIQDATLIKNGKCLLDSLTLKVMEGEHTAILGPNGAGKSALIRLITYQEYPLAHADATTTLSIFGQTLWNVFELRSILGIVSTDLHLSFLRGTLPGRTRGLDAVLSGFFASYGLFDHHRVTAPMRDRALKALAMIEAGHLADKFIEEMSTGEARRILIARALVSDPRALMLDEPTAGLDLLARYRFLSALRKIARNGKTIILATHNIEEIFPEIDRIILIRHGRVLLDGPKKAVLTSGNLSAMFGAPIQVRESQGYYTAASL